MDFESRSYNPGPVFRPKPFVLERPESKLWVVITSWTAQGEAEKVARLIAEEIEQSSGEDMTRIHDTSPQLNESGNRLRHALLSAAQQVYMQENAKQARVLLEALVIQVQGKSVAWAQAGQPNLFLLRSGRAAPLVVQPDHSVLDAGLPPLPMVALGLEPQTPVQTGSIRIEGSDGLLLLARSWDPAWPAWSENPDFATLTSHLIDDRPDLAFWCGLLKP